VLSLAFGVDAAGAAFPGANGRIAFTVEKWRQPPCVPTFPTVPHQCPEPSVVSSRIETVLPSGRGRRVLQDFTGEPTPYVPAWSPSGRLLAFEQGSRLATIRRDGTSLRRLPQLTQADLGPGWSPDGRRLAFAGNRRCFGCVWLYTVRLDGTGLRLVTDQGAGSAWSATGRLAFVNDDDVFRNPVGIKDGIYTIRPDGSRLRLLIAQRWAPFRHVDWSPDGSRIAFDNGNRIFTLGADGRGLRALTSRKMPRGSSSGAPAWSPDGRQIAFIRDHDLYVMRANGRGVRRLVDAPAQEIDDPDRRWAELGAPTWQPLPR
jgi:Tol biopolymer transport system component